MDRLSRLERAVIEKLLAEDHHALRVLRAQLRHAQVSGRTLTGSGFVTELSLPAGTAPAPIGSGMIRLGDVGAKIDGLRHGAGFLLYVRDGLLDALEGYSYDEPWPKKVGRFTVHFTKEGPRDLSMLRR